MSNTRYVSEQLFASNWNGPEVRKFKGEENVSCNLIIFYVSTCMCMI